MPQGPIPTTVAVQSGAQKPLNLDASGNLKVAVESNSAAGSDDATVAASQTKQALGTGAIGDTLASVTIVPGTTSPGIVEVYDSSSGTAIVLFAGGATSVPGLAPFTVSLNMVSADGGWKVTTGANVTAIAVGSFTA